MKMGTITINCKVSPAEFRQMQMVLDELCKLKPHEDHKAILERNFGMYRDSVNGESVMRYEVYDSDGERDRNRWYVLEDGKLVDWKNWKEKILDKK
ncbi:hypothetical protein HYT56_01165 [Candidatus Woesearchaeota archaeon]|nr:hypothetical protein [Candidatus Woesearchaeota archaeon]